MRVQTASFLALPVAATAFQLPFNLPKLDLTDLPSLQSVKSKVQSHIAIPSFVNKYFDHLTADSPLLSLHRELISIESTSGSEHNVAEWLKSYLESKNFNVELVPVREKEDGRTNVLAWPNGGSKYSRVLITSHIDTVPPYIPYSASAKTIYGRGSCDAKGSVAAQIIAVEELVASKALKDDDISLLYVVGEETTGDGMRAMNEFGLTWEAVIFGEPTEGKLAVGHKGLVIFEVKAEGKASHSGYPELGINANSNLIKALSKLDNLDLPFSKLLGNTTLNIGKISGGVAANVIPAHAVAEVSVRIAAGGVKKIHSLVAEAVEGIHGIDVNWELSPAYDPIVLDFDIEGFETIALSYGTDVPNLTGDHKKYLYGPGSIHVAHGDDEQVSVSDLQSAVKGYKRLVKQILAKKFSKPTSSATRSEKTTTPIIDTKTWSTPGNTIDPAGVAEKIFSNTALDETSSELPVLTGTETRTTLETVTTPVDAVDNAVEEETGSSKSKGL